MAVEGGMRYCRRVKLGKVAIHSKPVIRYLKENGDQQSE